MTEATQQAYALPADPTLEVLYDEFMEAVRVAHQAIQTLEGFPSESATRPAATAFPIRIAKRSALESKRCTRNWDWVGTRTSRSRG
jgi:hypothetical protein